MNNEQAVLKHLDFSSLKYHCKGFSKMALSFGDGLEPEETVTLSSSYPGGRISETFSDFCPSVIFMQAQLIAQAIGQAFSVAYQQFLHASGIDPSQVGPRRCGGDDDDDENSLLTAGEDLYNADLAHFSKQENCKEVRTDDIHSPGAGG